MAKDANPYENNSASGTGPYGQQAYQSHQYFGSPNHGGLPPESVISKYGSVGSGEHPRQLGEAQQATLLPFQPRIYQDGNHWYFEFTTSGVVFLPVATGTDGTVWHNHWNEAWPFRPKMADWNSTTAGAVVEINDVHNYGGGSDTRRPRLFLTDGARNVIYLQVTLLSNEDSISRRPDGTGAYGEGVIIKTPELSLVKHDGTTNNVNTEIEFDESSPTVDSDFNDHSHAINLSNFAIKYNSDGNATIHGNGIVHPKSFVPLGERNYFVQAAPEIKVVKANDGDNPADTPFSVRHNDWNNTDQQRVFPWGSIYIDNSTTPSTPKIDWWRYDCPTYNFNNRTVDMGTNPTADKHPKDHPNTEDGNVTNLTAPNDDGLRATT